MSILTRKIDGEGRLTLPSDFAGCLVTVERVGDEVRVRKAHQVPACRYSFKQLMAGVTPQNIHPEVEVAPTAGGETSVSLVPRSGLLKGILRAGCLCLAILGLSLLLMGGLLALVAGFVWVAADRLPSIALVNNTDQQLLVSSQGTSVVLPRETMANFPYPGNTQVFDVEFPESRITWRYTWAPCGLQYNIHNVIHMQLEPDGSIYLLSNAAHQPVIDLPPQPAGYPLKPMVLRLEKKAGDAGQ
jgi:hypothetical protein